MISLALLQSMFPGTPVEKLKAMVAPLEKACARYEINTKNRVAAFVAQTGHESAGMSRLTENLNYSADGLRKIFRKYFPTAEKANAYARKPEKIANLVYGSRMGNGPESTGDGWRFRGKGLIQLTGRSNVTAFAKDMGMTVEQASAYLETPEGAAMSAGWYWNSRNLNAYADKADIIGMTKVINGGTIGLDERKKLFEKARLKLATA